MNKLSFIFFILITINTQVSGQDLIFEDDFETGTFKPEWSLSPNIAGENGFINIGNTVGVDNSFGVRIGKLSDGSAFTTNGLDLQLDLAGKIDIELTFWISDRRDENQDSDGLYFSNDGGNSFKKVLDFFPGEWCDGLYGQHPPIDVGKLAAAADLDLTSQFIIRFQQTGLDDFSGSAASTTDGFYLDNVSISTYDSNLKYATIPFEDNFNTGRFHEAWAWNFADETSTIFTGNSITSPMSFVGILNQVGLDETPGVLMGRICDGTFTTNALDLHLDLSGETDVEMTFWIADHIDETQDDDGLYFSNDGGISFKKVLDFFPDEWCDFESFAYKKIYGQHPPIDIDGLAAAAGLELTSQFVIRFQQTGQNDFSGTAANNSDGFHLDNVSVYNPNLEYASLPFEDDFNTGRFHKAWAWNFADETAMVFTGHAITSPMSFVGILNQVGLDETPGVLLGRICDGTFTTNALDLHLDLFGETDVEMTFWIADHIDETQDDDGIYFSDDGGISFKKVLGFFPDEWCDFESFTYKKIYGQHPPIDIDELAAAAGLELTSQFVIRFQQTGQNDFSGTAANNSDGFHLDNVSVYDPDLEYASLPFEDDFETGLFKNAWAWNFADKTTTIVSDDAITNPMSRVEVINAFGHNNSNYAAWIGKICDGTFTTNALDLHLNLLDQTDVELTFWLADHRDETQVDEGIYLSNDGGENFIKVFDFDFSNAPNDQYELYQLNLSALAASNSLSLTDKFVIRFQQRGQKDFSGSGSSDTDGIYLDDVNVTGMITSSVSNDYSVQEVRLYPNPSSTALFLNTGRSNLKIATIEIVNLSGSTILRRTDFQYDSNYEMDISLLPKGLYIVSLILNDGRKVTKRLVKT